MAYHSDLFSEIKNRLTDWLESTGGAVTALEKDLLNRAQRSLWNNAPWDYLVKTQALALTNKAATLPADFGKVLSVWHDSDGDGRPDFYYYNSSRYADNGYYIRDAFAKATGHAWTITFFAAPSNTPYLEYQATLANFADSGTEYSFFPGDLLLLKAQEIHITEMGLVGSEYQAIKTRLEEELRDYKQAHQWINHDPRVVQNDWHGDPIEVPNYALDGSASVVSIDDHDPSYDRGN